MPFITSFRIWNGSNVRDWIIHDWGSIEWLAWAGATVYGLLYSAMLLACAWLVFRRKMMTL